MDGWHVDGIVRGRLTQFSLLCGIALTPQPDPGCGCLCVWPRSHHLLGKGREEIMVEMAVGEELSTHPPRRK